MDAVSVAPVTGTAPTSVPSGFLKFNICFPYQRDKDISKCDSHKLCISMGTKFYIFNVFFVCIYLASFGRVNMSSV